MHLRIKPRDGRFGAVTQARERRKRRAKTKRTRLEQSRSRSTCSPPRSQPSRPRSTQSSAEILAISAEIHTKLGRDSISELSVEGSRSPSRSLSRPRFVPSRARFLRLDQDHRPRFPQSWITKPISVPTFQKSRSPTEIFDRDFIAPVYFVLSGSVLARPVLWKIAGYKREALNNFKGSASFYSKASIESAAFSFFFSLALHHCHHC